MTNIKSIALTLLVMLSMPVMAHAGTPIPDAMAQKFFEKCLVGASSEGTMTAPNQKRYCACTARNMQRTMSQEDLRDLGATDPTTARAATNKVIADVNAPCSRFPIKDLLNKQCMTDLGNAAICTCLSEKMGTYVETQSTQLMGGILKSNPNIYDPTAPIMNSAEFQNTQKQIALGCATNPNQ